METVLALGIIAFAFVGLMGLLPLGLNNFRSAIDTSLGAQLFQRVVTDVEQTDFDVLLVQGEPSGGEFFVLPIRYFDEQGSEVVPTNGKVPSGAEMARVIYHVRVRGSRPGAANVALHDSSYFTSLPAAPGAVRFNPRDTIYLSVQIASNPGNRPLAVDDRALWKSGDVSLLSYAAVVARNGHQRNPK